MELLDILHDVNANEDADLLHLLNGISSLKSKPKAPPSEG